MTSTTDRNRRRRRHIGALAAVALAASACGSGTSGIAAEASADGPPSDAPASTTTIPSELITLPTTDIADLRFETFAALGGLRVGFDADALVMSDGDVVAVANPADDDPFSSVASVALVSQTLGANPIDGTDDFISLALDSGMTVEPSGTAIDALGLRLEGYRLELASMEPNYLLAASRLGENSAAAYAFSGAQVFLADVDGGVLIFAADGATESGRSTALSRLGDMVATAELLGPMSFPAPTARPSNGSPPSRPEIGERDPDLPPLDRQFRALEPGRYQLPRLGDTFALELGDDWWAQANTLGFVELSAPTSFGPGNDDLAFIVGLDEGQFSVSGPTFVGTPDDIGDLAGWVNSPPDGLAVSDVEQVDLGSRTATRFDVAIDEDATCQDADPCEYWMFSPVEAALVIKSGFDVRIWHVEDHEFAPLTIMASSSGPTWLDRATALVETIEFLG